MPKWFITMLSWVVCAELGCKGALMHMDQPRDTPLNQGDYDITWDK